MIEKSLISIIMPAYNAEKHIAESIESIIDQSYPNWELIIIDDGSTDGTKNKIESFLVDKRIQYYYQENARQGRARNNGIAHSKGEVLAFLDSDDRWTADKLQAQIDILSKTGADVIFTSAEIVNDAGIRIQDKLVQDGFWNSKTMFLSMLNGLNPIIFSSVILSRARLDMAGGFDETAEIAEDYHLWLRLCDQGCNFYGTAKKLVKYRIHESQTSSSELRIFELSLNAYKGAKLTSISNRIKSKFMEIRLNRYLLHNLRKLSFRDRINLIKYYRDPMKMYFKFSILNMLLFLGTHIFERFGYKYFELQIPQSLN